MVVNMIMTGAKMKKYRIQHLNQVLETNHYVYFEPEKCEQIRADFYQKPEWDEVRKNLIAIESGGTSVATINDFYFKDLMAKVKLYSPRWSIEEVLQSDELLGYFWSRILASDKVFPKNAPLIKNFETAFRISGGGVTMKPSNFPMKSVDRILQKYNLNNSYLDFSCGWGVRMLSAFKHRIDYFGIEPNFLLVERLQQLHQDYQTVNLVQVNKEIRVTGSEILQSDWQGKFGLVFSSPPYFNLEDYKIGEQSYKKGVSFSDWLTNYLNPTILNIHTYLIPNGFFAINIKNFADYKLTEAVFNMANGLFEHQETICLENIKRPSAKKDLNTDENIFIFRKLQ